MDDVGVSDNEEKLMYFFGNYVKWNGVVCSYERVEFNLPVDTQKNGFWSSLVFASSTKTKQLNFSVMLWALMGEMSRSNSDLSGKKVS